MGPRQTDRQFADGIFKFIFGNENLLCFHWNITACVPSASCCGKGSHNATDQHAVVLIRRPFHWYRNSNSMELSFCSHPSSSEMVVILHMVRQLCCPDVKNHVAAWYATIELLSNQFSVEFEFDLRWKNRSWIWAPGPFYWQRLLKPASSLGHD